MERDVPRSKSIFILSGLLLAATIALSGCSGTMSPNGNPISDPSSSELTGRLSGGQFPITSATIQLYTAGSTGYGVGAQALLSPALITGENGDFDITPSDYTCPTASTPTYIVASGGDPGLGQNNSAIILMAALGPCGSLTSIPFVNVNEVTTVSSVWALAQFLGSGAQIGTSSTNSQGLANAFANVNNIVDITKGVSPGSQGPSGAIVPVAKIYTLANILAACVNSTGSSTCSSLFALATPSGGNAPTNTLDAALNIALHPSSNAASLFAVAASQPPFLPSLSAAPKDWMIAVTFNGGGLNFPASIALDASGNVWAANYCGSNSPCSSVTELSPAGQPLSPSNGFSDTPDTLWEDYGLAIDPGGNVWVTNQQSASSVNGGQGSVSKLSNSGQIGSTFSGGGVYFPVAVAADTDGTIWVANEGDSTVSKLGANGSAISGSGGWGAGQLAGPSAVAIDANHFAWFANQYASSGSVTSISPDGNTVNVISSGGDHPSSIATDRIGTSGHVWIANYSTSSVSELQLNNNGTGNVVSSGYSGGGIDHPNGIAVDGSGNVWVTNKVGNSLTELQGANGTSPGQPLSSAGLGTDANLSEPDGIAFDSSGNVWVSNPGSNSITQFVGAAMPVKTPLVGPPQVP